MARKVSVGVIIYIITRLAIDSCSAQFFGVLGVTFTFRGNKVGTSSQPVDLNTLTADGYYTIQGNISNGPSGIDARTWGGCIVFRLNTSGVSVLQVLTHDVGNTHSLYVREVDSDGTGMLPWTKIAG